MRVGKRKDKKKGEGAGADTLFDLARKKSKYLNRKVGRNVKKNTTRAEFEIR